jgi:hypothetical protein
LKEKSFVTVVTYPGDHAVDEHQWLEESIGKALILDDVLNEEFLHTILITGPGAEAFMAESAEDLLRSAGESWGTVNVQILGDESELLPGPYAVIGQELWQIHRLYEDTQGAFLVPVKKSQGSK